VEAVSAGTRRAVQLQLRRVSAEELEQLRQQERQAEIDKVVAAAGPLPTQ
jgi:hypothetical protein